MVLSRGAFLRQRSIFVAIWRSKTCEILGSHSGVAEVSSLLGCGAVTLGRQFLTWAPNTEMSSPLRNVLNFSLQPIFTYRDVEQFCDIGH